MEIPLRITDNRTKPNLQKLLFGLFCQVVSTRTTSAERLLLSMLLLDLRHYRWQDHWEKLIKENSKRRFVLDMLTDKIWQLIHTRPLPDAERDKLAQVTVRIEEAFGAPKSAKSSIIAGIRRSAAETKRRDG
jgi:hypothetical protein